MDDLCCDLADMELISTCNKGICVLLSAISVFSKLCLGCSSEG